MDEAPEDMFGEWSHPTYDRAFPQLHYPQSLLHSLSQSFSHWFTQRESTESGSFTCRLPQVKDLALREVRQGRSWKLYKAKRMLL